MDRTHYISLSHLFDYPDLEFQNRVRAAQALIREHHPEGADELDKFVSFLPEVDPDYPEGAVIEMGELHTRSFDVQSITSLDIGFNMFGDDYKRGEFLVNLKREHRLVDNDCGNELADHLPTMLRLIARCRDLDLVKELIHEVLAPTLKAMIGEFNPGRLTSKEKLYKKHYKTIIDTSPKRQLMYCHALRSLYQVLQKDFGFRVKPKLERNSDFLRSIGRELEIENDARPQ